MNTVKENNKSEIHIGEKYMLTIKEASQYFNLGVKKLRRLAENNVGGFAIYSGNRYLIIRVKLEEFIMESSAI